MIAVWLGWATITWVAIHAGFAGWGRGFGLDPGPPDARRRGVRVVIPARDEAIAIAAAVRAVLGDPAIDELVVVDDGSTDDTAAVAIRAAAGDARFTLRPAAPRPDGWAGKPWACAEGARDAVLPWLLFVDADVTLAPGAPAAAIDRADAARADFASLFGTWTLDSFWERLCIPAIGWTIRSAVDLAAVNDGRRAFANGQFVLIRREAYARLGGHAVVRGEILDDVRLAEAARAAGLRLGLWWAPWAFRVRLYRSLGEIVAGYRKNLYEGLGRRPWIAAPAALAVLAATTLPAVALPLLIAADRPGLAAWAGLVVALQVALRARIELRDRRSPTIALLHPLAGAVLAAVLLLSMAPGATWKGRVFVRGRAVTPP